MMSLTDDQGRTIVGIARAALESRVRRSRAVTQSWTEGYLSEVRGVFVTLNSTVPGAERLRGCIGFPYPVKPLGEAVQEAASAAATEDPRFPPVSPPELDSIAVEVSVLTSPTALVAPRRTDLPKMVRVGTDGLIVSRPPYSGLLLPQVATEFGLGPEEFLSQASMKAGLTPDAWLDPETAVQRFQAEIFAEEKPRGRVARVET